MVGVTTTGNVQTDSFPEASVAVQVTSVVPRGKKLPEGGMQTTVGHGSVASLAVTEKDTISPGDPLLMSTAETDGGQDSTGGVVSGASSKRIHTAPCSLPPSSSPFAPTTRSRPPSPSTSSRAMDFPKWSEPASIPSNPPD